MPKTMDDSRLCRPAKAPDAAPGDSRRANASRSAAKARWPMARSGGSIQARQAPRAERQISVGGSVPEPSLSVSLTSSRHPLL